MADKSALIVLDALSKAVAVPQGTLLHGTKANPGLFATGTSAKQAAERCKEEGYLSVVRTETRGKTTQEICAITEKGLAYLLAQVSPRKVLEDMVHTLQSRQNEAGELLVAARQMQAGLDAFKATAEKVLQAVCQGHGSASSASGAGTGNGKNGKASSNGEAKNGAASGQLPVVSVTATVLAALERWQASGSSEDCSLAELYRQTCQSAANLTIGQFHDTLRRLQDQRQIYLHPWTGPMHEIPDPSSALMVGHEIAYYASLRHGVTG